MNNFYSRLGWFSLGVTFGVLVTFFYEVFGKPALPKVEKCNVTWRYVNFDELMPEYAPPLEKDDWYAFEQSFDDTQPVRTHE